MPTGSYDPREKTQNVSFRIPASLADALETEASVKKINTSSLLAQVLRHHIGYEGTSARAGLVSFPKELLIKLMESFSEKQVIEMAKNISGDSMVDRMFSLKGDFTLESFLSMIEDNARANNFPLRKEKKAILTSFVIQHDMSKNWSIYLGYLYKFVIEELAQKRVAIDISDHTVRFRF